jgi:hypothetical protein
MFGQIEPESAPAPASSNATRMWQRFLASLIRRSVSPKCPPDKLVAGPIQRKVAIEAVVKPD